MASLFRPIVVNPRIKHTASIIFLHGSGDTGSGVQSWVASLLEGEPFEFDHAKVIFPTAKARPYTPMQGAMSTVWFDRLQISPRVPEHTATIKESCDLLDRLIEDEIKLGIPKQRIIVGGFSMGGSLAMYYGYKHAHDLGGIFAMSSFLQDKSSVYELLKTRDPNASMPPLFQYHGHLDALVSLSWGKTTSERLQQLGVKCRWQTEKLFHEMSHTEIEQLMTWIDNILSNNS